MSKEEILRAAFEKAKIRYPSENWKRWDELPIEKEFVLAAMTEYAHRAIEEAAEAATLKTEPCGDPMTCGCQGTCDHPYYSINKQSILKLKEKY